MQVAIAPLLAIAVIIAVPGEIPWMFPFPSTAATLVLLLLHIIFLFVALLGFTTAINWIDKPGTIVAVVLDNEILVTGTLLATTVRFKIASLLFVVFAVIITLPAECPITFPLLTVATLVLLLVHAIDLFVAFSGVIVAFKSIASPIFIVVAAWLITIPVGDISFSIATTSHSTLAALLAIAVIFTFPFDNNVTIPFSLTVATFSLLLVHTTFLFVALLGVIDAVNFKVSPTSPTADVWSNVIFSTSTAFFATLIVHVTLSPLLAVAVIVTVPFETALTVPSASIVAMLGSLLFHVRRLSLASAGSIIGVILKESPTLIVVLFLLKLIALTGIANTVTFITFVILSSPVTTISVEPLVLATILPSTISTTSGFLLAHLMSWSVAFAGWNKTSIVSSSLIPSSTSYFDNIISVALILLNGFLITPLSINTPIITINRTPIINTYFFLTLVIYTTPILI